MSRYTAVACLVVWAFGTSFLGAFAADRDGPAKLAEDPSSDMMVFDAAGNPAFEYRSLASPNKPYVRRLFTPGGVQILQDSPKDHKHHHGLMFAVGVDGVDFWGEAGGAGMQVVRSVSQDAKGSKSKSQTVKVTGDGRVVSRTQGYDVRYISLDSRLDWIDVQKGRSLLQEKRRVRLVVDPKISANLLTWQTTLQLSPGRPTVVFDGHHYYGLGMRFVAAMDAAGKFITSDDRPSESVRGSEKLTTARWCAFQSNVDGKPVTTAIFDAPSNPRFPNRFFTMRPFAYMSATLNLWKEPLTLNAGSRLNLKYGVAVWDGHVEKSEIENTYLAWLKAEKEKTSATALRLPGDGPADRKTPAVGK